MSQLLGFRRMKNFGFKQGGEGIKLRQDDHIIHHYFALHFNKLSKQHRFFRLRLFNIAEQQNTMPNNKFLYIRDPLFLLFTASVVCFCSSFWVGFLVDTLGILYFKYQLFKTNKLNNAFSSRNIASSLLYLFIKRFGLTFCSISRCAVCRNMRGFFVGKQQRYQIFILRDGGGDVLLRGIRPFCKLWKRVLSKNPFQDLGKSLFASCLFFSHTTTRFTYSHLQLKYKSNKNVKHANYKTYH